MNTKEYRKAQFGRLDPVDDEYKPKIKVVSSTGSTYWLSITKAELWSIRIILTE